MAWQDAEDIDHVYERRWAEQDVSIARVPVIPPSFWYSRYCTSAVNEPLLHSVVILTCTGHDPDVRWLTANVIVRVYFELPSILSAFNLNYRVYCERVLRTTMSLWACILNYCEYCELVLWNSVSRVRMYFQLLWVLCSYFEPLWVLWIWTTTYSEYYDNVLWINVITKFVPWTILSTVILHFVQWNCRYFALTCRRSASDHWEDWNWAIYSLALTHEMTLWINGIDALKISNLELDYVTDGWILGETHGVLPYGLVQRFVRTDLWRRGLQSEAIQSTIKATNDRTGQTLR